MANRGEILKKLTLWCLEKSTSQVVTRYCIFLTGTTRSTSLELLAFYYGGESILMSTGIFHTSFISYFFSIVWSRGYQGTGAWYLVLCCIPLILFPMSPRPLTRPPSKRGARFHPSPSSYVLIKYCVMMGDAQIHSMVNGPYITSRFIDDSFIYRCLCILLSYSTPKDSRFY